MARQAAFLSHQRSLGWARQPHSTRGPVDLPGGRLMTASGDVPAPMPDGPAWRPSDDDDLAIFVLRRLEDHRRLFNRGAEHARLFYLSFKVIQVVLAAAVPVAASVHAPIALTGSLGAAVVVIEGVQQLFQWHANWIRYRTAEAGLRHERFLYRARIGDYATSLDPTRLLADRTEGLNTTEHAGWAHTFGSSGEASRRSLDNPGS